MDPEGRGEGGNGTSPLAAPPPSILMLKLATIVIFYNALPITIPRFDRIAILSILLMSVLPPLPPTLTRID